jgi:BASS family bile acid:Na+ symporter
VDLAKLLQLVLSASIMMIVLSMGLQATPQDATCLFRQPRRFVRSLFAMVVVMPVLACIIVSALPLLTPVKITLITLSVSPVPPILPRRALAAGGSRSYALGLLVAAGVCSTLLVPAWMELFERVFDRSAQMSPFTIARIVATTVILPLAAGLALRSLSGRVATRLAAPLSRLAMALLIASVLPVLFTQTSAAVGLLRDGTLLAMTVFVSAGLATGAVLGGPDLAHRTVLALSTACRHPGVAVAIATTNFPNEKLVLTAILL